jgi:hypothetical protein
MSEPDSGALRGALATRHLQLGWVLIFVWLCFGMVLDVLHGFKVGFYLDVSNETRRHMWTLAHTHGTLIGVVNLAFCATIARIALTDRLLKLASVCLVVAGIGMPLGFLLGGVVVYGGDPGLPIFLVPPSASLFVLGAALIAWGALRGGQAGGVGKEERS